MYAWQYGGRPRQRNLVTLSGTLLARLVRCRPGGRFMFRNEDAAVPAETPFVASVDEKARSFTAALVKTQNDARSVFIPAARRYVYFKPLPGAEARPELEQAGGVSILSWA